MTEPRKTPPPKGKGRKTPSQKKKNTQRIPQTPVSSKKNLSRHERDEQQSKLVTTVFWGVVGVVGVLIAVGLIYDQVWLPTRTIAQVNDEKLSRGEYWERAREQFAQDVVQNLQLVAMFGDNPQFSDQFANRSPMINQQVDAIRRSPEEEQIVSTWEEEQLILQGAEELGIEITREEVTQQIAYTLSNFFLQEEQEGEAAEEADSTGFLTDTTLLSPTDALTITDAADEVDEDAAEVDEPDADEVDADEVMPPADATPTMMPTPQPDVAATQLDQIVEEVYKLYTAELEAMDMKPELRRADFVEGLHTQYRQQLVSEKVREELLPEDEFEPSDEPTKVTARHILLMVDVDEDASEEERDEAYEARLDEAKELVEQLRDGADFAELAAEHSEDPGSKDNGGDVGSFNREGLADNGGNFVPEFVEAAFALEEGEISDPVRTQFGWHIIQTTSKEVPGEEQQLTTARTEAFDEWLEEQREEATVKRFPEPTATPTIEGAEEGEGEQGEQGETEEEFPTPEPTYLPGPPTPLPTEAGGAPNDFGLDTEVPMEPDTAEEPAADEVEEAEEAEEDTVDSEDNEDSEDSERGESEGLNDSIRSLLP
jgi:parvulin-like peptidyl-prolyl isomerase